MLKLSKNRKYQIALCLEILMGTLVVAVFIWLFLSMR